MNTATAEKQNKIMYISQAKDFANLPGQPSAYSVSKRFIENYHNLSLSKYGEVITGMTIRDNNKYLRLWYEVNRGCIALSCSSMAMIDLRVTKWIPYSKGGTRRNWYGNYEYLVNWAGKEYFNRSKTTLQHLYLREAISWPFITPGKFSARLLPIGSLWDVAGSPCFFKDKETEYYFLGLLCSKPADYMLKVVNPTINIQAIDAAQIPVIKETEKNDLIIRLVQSNIENSKCDWDSFETSWDFKRHPLI